MTNVTSNTSETNVSVYCGDNPLCEPPDQYVDRLYKSIYPEPGEWVLVAAYALTFSIGLLGNSLVCFAIWRNKNMRTITNVFILNLAIADLLVIMLVLPSALIVDITGTWFLGKALCKIHIFLTTTSVSVSVLTLSAISVERWYAICHPLRFHSTMRRARTIIVGVWVVSLCVSIPELIASNINPLRQDTVLYTSCYPSLWDTHDVVIFQICLMAGLYFLPLCLMAFTYIHIAWVLWGDHAYRSSKTDKQKPMLKRNTTTDTDEQIEGRKKAAKMLVAVVIVFGLCFLPNHLLNIFRYLDKLDSLPYMNIFALIAHWATFFNSCINPVIYNFMSDKFRKEFRVSVWMCVHCGRRPNQFRRNDQYKMTFLQSGQTYSVRYTSHCVSSNGHHGVHHLNTDTSSTKDIVA